MKVKIGWRERLEALKGIGNPNARPKPELYIVPEGAVYRHEKPKLVKGMQARLNKYNITWEDFCGLWREQRGVCAICNDPLKLSCDIDHDHRTGIVRGLLCRPCNSGIGLLKDDPVIILNGADYLARHEGLVERVFKAHFAKRNPDEQA